MSCQYISDYIYCCTVHFEDSLSITHQRMHICCHITDKHNDIFTILTCNFSKEQYVLPEDDLRIETCSSILRVLM